MSIINTKNPMLGRYCLIRTYSAGVHAGVVKEVDQTYVHLFDSIRIWKWEKGGLSLSSIANKGMKGGYTDPTGEVYLTEVIEIIPVTDVAKASYLNFISKV